MDDLAAFDSKSTDIHSQARRTRVRAEILLNSFLSSNADEAVSSISISYYFRNKVPLNMPSASLSHVAPNVKLAMWTAMKRTGWYILYLLNYGSSSINTSASEATMALKLISNERNRV